MAPLEDLTKMIKQYALSEGMDLVRIGPISRFDSAPKGYHPEDSLPGTRSVIMMAAKQLDGTVDQIPKSRVEYTMNFYESSWLLNTTSYKVAKFLEKEGYKSYSVSYIWFSDTDFVGLPKYEFYTLRTPLSFQHAAEACGMGRRGLSSLLMTPEFGPRIRLIGVLTTAPLVPDEMLPGKLCDPDKCGIRCAKACPVSAITRDHGLYRPRCFSGVITAGQRCGICMQQCPSPPILQEWMKLPENLLDSPDKLVDWGDTTDGRIL